jgi:hypothetical protein
MGHYFDVRANVERLRKPGSPIQGEDLERFTSAFRGWARLSGSRSGSARSTPLAFATPCKKSSSWSRGKPLDVGKEQELLDWMGASCWFCGERPPVHGMSRIVKLNKGAAAAGGGMSILHSAVAVPRCAGCLAGHERVNGIAFAICGAGAIAAFLILVVWSPIDVAGWLKGGPRSSVSRTGGCSWPGRWGCRGPEAGDRGHGLRRRRGDEARRLGDRRRAATDARRRELTCCS